MVVNRSRNWHGFAARHPTQGDFDVKKMFIGGRWVAARDERTLPVVAPADGAAFDQISRGGAHEVDAAVQAARASLAGPWGA